MPTTDNYPVTITVKFIVRNYEEENALNKELRHSEILNNWPVFTWDAEDSTEEEVEWFEREYNGDD